MAAERRWDMTAKVNGHGCSCTLTWGGYTERPSAVRETDILDAAEAQFRWAFNLEPQTSGVTVGPQRSEGDDDHPVG